MRHVRWFLGIALVLFVSQGALAEQDVRAYIKKAWRTLERSAVDRRAFEDPKIVGKPVLYLPHGAAVPADAKALQGVEILHLPRKITRLGEVSPAKLERQGLLYLPHPYVVPGGMFNEMYGWDSYFIIRGLLRDGEVAMARGMVENWIYEIEHYGAILNANRTYYLTRSQPPFLAAAIRAVYEAKPDKAWLQRAYGYAKRDHAMWTSAPFLAGKTGLSRYFDVGHGPIPEMGAHENYFQQVAAYALTHFVDYVRRGPGKGVPTYALRVSQGEVSSAPVEVHLTPDFFLGDRAMRASGFDVSFRFGPFSGATHHYAAVCLNSLLYRAEKDLAWMARTLGRPAEAARWDVAAASRGTAMRRRLWSPTTGMFFDWDAVKGRQSTYRYATTFYPLWAGLVTPAEARAVAKSLRFFEQPHGLAMSDVRTGAQWDLPFGWAPVHLLAVEGLERYGFHADARRIARKFNDTVARNFRRDGTIREKYDVVTGSSETRISVGYSENVVGFGWTNAVYVVFDRLLQGFPGHSRRSAAPNTLMEVPR